MSEPSRTARRLGTAVRLSGYLALVLVIVLGISAWVTWSSFSKWTTAQAQANLDAAMSDFQKSVSQKGPEPLATWTVHYLASTVLPEGQTTMVGLAGGVHYGSAASGQALRSPDILGLLQRPPAATHLYTISGVSLDALVLVSPIKQSNRVVGSVVTTYNLASLHADQARVLWLALAEAGAALFAAVAGAFFLLRRLLGTIGDITETARTIQEGELDRRLGDQGTDDEVGELAATFDEMLDKIDDAMTVQRRLLSDVSHQLRTPLTVARGHLEVLERTGINNPREVADTIKVVIAELEQMRALTEQLLLLGHALEPDFLVIGPIDLRSLARDLEEAARILGPQNVEIGAIDDLVIAVDEKKVRGALLNLIDNAFQATGPSDRIRISAYRSSTGEITIEIADSGPGISTELRSRVIQRFGRPDSVTRKGSGLGLAIVGAVAAAHGGRLELGDSYLGGLSATLVLPPTVEVTLDSFEATP